MPGIYIKVCQFDYCQREFEGRKDQKFCCVKCKQHENNNKAAERKMLVKKHTQKLEKAISILNGIFKRNENDECIVPILVMEQLGFPKDCPYLPMKDDRYKDPFMLIGNFAYQIRNNNFVIIKKRKYGTSML